jgi:hypothetical protein
MSDGIIYVCVNVYASEFQFSVFMLLSLWLHNPMTDVATLTNIYIGEFKVCIVGLCFGVSVQLMRYSKERKQ